MAFNAIMQIMRNYEVLSSRSAAVSVLDSYTNHRPGQLVMLTYLYGSGEQKKTGALLAMGIKNGGQGKSGPDYYTIISDSANLDDSYIAKFNGPDSNHQGTAGHIPVIAQDNNLNDSGVSVTDSPDETSSSTIMTSSAVVTLVERNRFKLSVTGPLKYDAAASELSIELPFTVGPDQTVTFGNSVRFNGTVFMNAQEEEYAVEQDGTSNTAEVLWTAPDGLVRKTQIDNIIIDGFTVSGSYTVWTELTDEQFSSLVKYPEWQSPSIGSVKKIKDKVDAVSKYYNYYKNMIFDWAWVETNDPADYVHDAVEYGRPADVQAKLDAGEKVVYTLNSVSKEFSLADTTQDMCLFVEVPDDVDSAFSLSEGDLIITYNADGD